VSASLVPASFAVATLVMNRRGRNTGGISSKLMVHEVHTSIHSSSGGIEAGLIVPEASEGSAAPPGCLTQSCRVTDRRTRAE